MLLIPENTKEKEYLINGFPIKTVFVIVGSTIGVFAITHYVFNFGIMFSLLPSVLILMTLALLLKPNLFMKKFTGVEWIRKSNEFKNDKNVFYKDELDQIKIIDGIKENSIKLSSGKHTSFVEINPIGIDLFDIPSQHGIIDRLNTVFRLCKFRITLHKVEKSFNFQNKIENMKEMARKYGENDKHRKEITLNNLMYLESLSEKNNSTRPYYYLQVSARTESRLSDIIDTLGDVLSQSNMHFKILSPDEAKEIIEIIVPWKSGDDGVIFNKNKIIATNNEYSYYYIRKMPNSINRLSWLSQLTELDFIDFSFIINHTPIKEAKKSISRARNMVRETISEKKTDWEKIDVKKEYHEYGNLLEMITNGEIGMKDVTYVIKVKDEDLNKDKFRKFKQALLMENIAVELLKNDQKNICLSSIGMGHFKINSKYIIETPTNTLAAAYPFLASAINHKEGMFLGYDSNGLPIFFDPAEYNDDIKNRNLAILGKSGAGKTVTTTKLMKDSIAMGRQIFCYDRNGEHERFTTKMGGATFKLGSSESEDSINPLKPFTKLMSSGHLGFIGEFYKTLFGDTNNIDYLVSATGKVYKDFGIKNGTKVSSVKKWPTLDDVYSRLKEFKGGTWGDKDSMLISFSQFTKDGVFDGVWNRETSVKFDPNFPIYNFDMSDVFAKANTKIIASTNIVLFTIWEDVMIENIKYNEEKLGLGWNDDPKARLIVFNIEEGHSVIDKYNHYVAKRINEMFKMARKFGCLMWISTQNLNDFFGEKTLLKEATGIFNQCDKLLFLGLSESDIKKLKEIFSDGEALTDTEAYYLSRAKRGSGVIKIGNEIRTIISVDMNASERVIMGFEETNEDWEFFRDSYLTIAEEELKNEDTKKH